MLVVDASVLVVALADDEHHGGMARECLRGQDLAAPELIDLEVGSVLRRHVAIGAVLPKRATLALDDLAAMPLERASHRALVSRCWELRENLTMYDAAYVALAELLECSLLTGDRRLVRASGPRCTIEVLDVSA